MGTEHKLKGVDVQLGPVVGLSVVLPKLVATGRGFHLILSSRVSLLARQSRVFKMPA
jgi:hypothetical protein